MWSASVYASVRQIGFSLWLAVNNRFHVTMAPRPCIIPRHPRYYTRFDASNFSDKLSFSFSFPFFFFLTDTRQAHENLCHRLFRGNFCDNLVCTSFYSLYLIRKGNGLIDRIDPSFLSFNYQKICSLRFLFLWFVRLLNSDASPRLFSIQSYFSGEM